MKKEGICHGWKLKVKEAEDPDSPMTSVNIYKNGTVMVQGNLRQFELDFPLIKERAQQEKSPPPEDIHTLPDTDTTSTPTCPPADQKNEPSSSEHAQDPKLTSIITDMKVKFSELERDLVQLRELTSHQVSQEEVCNLSTELSRPRQDRELQQHQRAT